MKYEETRYSTVLAKTVASVLCEIHICLRHIFKASMFHVPGMCVWSPAHRKTISAKEADKD